jgi:hypothetical protein
MKNRTRNDYLRRIDRVIALLQQVVANDAELPNCRTWRNLARPRSFRRSISIACIAR